jgi:DNA polymerase III epsilon subunit-like protein
MSAQSKESFISVDVETTGPNPGRYSLLSIGACVVFDPEKQFYVELQPINQNATEDAMRVTGLKLEELARSGLTPQEGMYRFAQWVGDVTPKGSHPIFVAFNAPFDWMFVHEYFHRYLRHNPFGHKALDIKAFYMGMTGVSWRETGMSQVSKRFLGERELTHNALQDALDQAEIFRGMLAVAKNEQNKENLR